MKSSIINSPYVTTARHTPEHAMGCAKFGKRKKCVINNTLASNVKLIGYAPEHSMGFAKMRNRKRVVANFIPTAKQRNRELTSLTN